MLDNYIINDTVQISIAVLIYEIIVIILYYFKKIDRFFLSWPVLINFFIIFVLLFCKCNLPMNVIILTLFVKILFLCIILSIAEFSLKNYLISLCILIIYYFISDINKIYSCNVKFNCLIMSLLISSIIYAGHLYNNSLM